jgi:hypothetical protein
LLIPEDVLREKAGVTTTVVFPPKGFIQNPFGSRAKRFITAQDANTD